MLIVQAFVFCGNGVKNDLNDENWEYDWEWIVKPEEYEDCFFLNEDLIAVKKVMENTALQIQKKGLFLHRSMMQQESTTKALCAFKMMENASI